MNFVIYFYVIVMGFEIAIPSYNRQFIIKKKTLALLSKYSFPKERIKIFLVDDDMRKKYIEELGKDYQFVITGCNGIMETRNFLKTYYREQTKTDWVLYMDDDVTNFQEMGVNVTDFQQVVNYMFETTEKLGLNLFAPSAYNNKFYMDNRVTTSLKYIIGAFSGEIIDRNKYEIHCDIGHFEDFQFTMEYFLRDGGVVRFNKYNIITKYFELKGGICGQLGGMKARQAEMETNGHYLVQRYAAVSYTHLTLPTILRV